MNLESCIKKILKQSDIVCMKRLMLVLVFFCSCQSKEIERFVLNETEKLDLLYLFDDLYRAVSCNERQELIENNKTLQAFGRQYDLPRGYLFDMFSHTAKLKDQSIEKRLVSAILDVWKISASERVIKGIMEEVSKCYPIEYWELEYRKSKESYRLPSRSSSSRSRSSSTDRTNANSNVCDVRKKILTVQSVREILEVLQKETGCETATEDELSSIRYLRLVNLLNSDGERITTLKANDLTGLRSLHALSIINNPKLTTLPTGIFNGLSSLTVLRLLSMGLTSLHPNIFNSLRSSLKELELSILPDLTSLHSNIFNGLSSLKELDIYMTAINSLPAGIFNGLNSLKRLRVDGNTSLGSLPAGIFNGLNSLEELDLRDNSFSSLPAGIFNGLSSLELLDLRDNNFSATEKQRIRSEVTSSLPSVTLRL